MSSLSLTAQNKDTSTADKYFARYDFNQAIEAYDKLVEKGKADEYVYTRLAEANYNIYNTVEAERWFAKALVSSQNPETIYKYSQMLPISHELNRCIAIQTKELKRFQKGRIRTLKKYVWQSQ